MLPPLFEELSESSLRLLMAMLGQQYRAGREQGKVEATRETLGRFYGFAQGRPETIAQLEALLAQLKGEQPN